jgi:hypothetical protein
MPLKLGKKIEELNAACRAAIIGGFTSSALGAPHRYDSEEVDQLNLIGAVATGGDLVYRCTDALGVKDWRLHTAAQLHQVLADGAARKGALLHQASSLKAQAAEATTYELLQAIVWSDPA